MALLIYHVYKGDPQYSSRLNEQLSIDDGKVLEAKKYLSISFIFDLINKSTSGDVIIFHQQRMLLTMLVFNLFSRGRAVFYDMHDINEYKSWFSVKERLFYLTSYFLEWVLVFTSISVMTVSKGLSRVFFKRYGINSTVFESIPIKISENEAVEKKNVCVYFGMINQERLPIKLINTIGEHGINVDVYGVFGCEMYKEKVLACHNVSYLGGYNSHNIQDLISGYQFSLIYIENEYINIRYCLPNKLFQSLSSGVPCFISKNLKEIKIRYGSIGVFNDLDDCQGVTVNIEDLESKSIVNLKKYREVLKIRRKRV